MKLAVDVHYGTESATVAGVLFANPDDCEPMLELAVRVPVEAEYQPGQFYKRELPCILALLEQIDELPDLIVIDGYVYLGGDGKPGLGKHLYDALNGRCAVIGVAKTRYKETPAVAELVRGSSKRPLYVTAAGMGQEHARQFIKNMCGDGRLPLLLKRVDQLCRGIR